MKRNSLFPLFLLTFVSSQISWADTVTVPVPGSDVSPTESAMKAHALPSPDLFDISMSSWSPSEMNPYSIAPGVSAFSASFPGISLSYLSDMKKNAAGDFFYRLGAEFRKESRSAPGSDPEDLYLITIRAGIEWKPLKIQSNHFLPYVGFSLLPTLATASDETSVYDDGISTLYLPVEFDLGGEIPLGSTPSSVRLTAAGQLVIGRILGSSLVSTGIIGGVRFPL